MIKAVVIDDEEDARFMLKDNIEKNFADQVNIIGEANGVKSGLKLIRELQPDLVFLDIQMRDGSGFDLLNQIPEKNFEVVFITAYNQYALKAFQFSALGYLMKPIKINELKNTLQILVSHFEKYRIDSDKRLKVLVENYGDDKTIKKIVIPSVKGFNILSLEEIVRVEGDRNYSHFILQNGTKVVSTKTLAEYENQLSDYGFFRIHQSTIVNLRHVVSYEKGDGGLVEMIDGTKSQLSRNRKTYFLKRFLQ